MRRISAAAVSDPINCCASILLNDPSHVTNGSTLQDAENVNGKLLQLTTRCAKKNQQVLRWHNFVIVGINENVTIKHIYLRNESCMYYNYLPQLVS